MTEPYLIKVKQFVGQTHSPGVGPVYLHIEKGYFADIATSFQALPSGLRLIDESDKVAVPGLIDMHVHLTRDEPGAEINLAPLYLAHGVTSVRDVGSDLFAIKRIQTAIESGEVHGPRIFFCGPQLNGKAFRSGMCNLQTPEQARAKVKELHHSGVHALKVYDQLAPEITRVVIEEAGNTELPVCGHLGKTKAHEAIAFGINGLEHLTSLIFDLFDSRSGPLNPFSRDVFHQISAVDINNAGAQQLRESAVDHGVFIDPTLVVFDRIMRFPELKHSKQESFIPRVLRAYWLARMTKFVGGWGCDDFAIAKSSFVKLQAWIRVLESEGTQVIAGTDTPNPYLVPGQSLLDEIKLLTESGLSNRAAIDAATTVASRALNQSREIGSILRGKRADYLLLRGDPIDDISALENISAVYKDGVRYDPEALKRIAAEMLPSGPA